MPKEFAWGDVAKDLNFGANMTDIDCLILRVHIILLHRHMQNMSILHTLSNLLSDYITVLCCLSMRIS